MLSRSVELDHAYLPAADQPLPLIVAFPIIMGLSATLWLMIVWLAKAMLGL